MKAPSISKDLVEYLEQVFPRRFPSTHQDTLPHVIAARAHQLEGMRAVVSHLVALYETQQNEDLLNVHEGT